MEDNLRCLTEMKFKTWFWLEEIDLLKRLRQYSRYRLLLAMTSVLGFVVSLFWLWQKTEVSSRVKFVDDFFINSLSFLRLPFYYEFFSIITLFGSAQFILGFFLIFATVMVLKRRKRIAAVALICLTGSFLFILLLKGYFGRQRPTGCIYPNDCFSYPSGHSTLAVYFYGLLNYLILRYKPMKIKYHLLITFALVSLVCLVAFSRIVLSVHFPSDIIAGFFLGGAWLSLTVLLIDILS